MKTPTQILKLPHYANKIESQFGMTVTDIKEAMEEYLNSRWVSVDERLPPYGETVLCVVFDRGRDIDIVKPLCRLTHMKPNDFWDYNNSDYHAENLVKFWQPLPLPPTP